MGVQVQGGRDAKEDAKLWWPPLLGASLKEQPSELWVRNYVNPRRQLWCLPCAQSRAWPQAADRQCLLGADGHETGSILAALMCVRQQRLRLAEAQLRAAHCLGGQAGAQATMPGV